MLYVLLDNLGWVCVFMFLWSVFVDDLFLTPIFKCKCEKKDH